MTVRELNDKMQAVDIDQIIRDAVIKNGSKLVSLNRGQLVKGLTSEGETIEPPLRSYTYAKDKKSAGGQAPFWIPDMKNTGAFQRDMYLIVEDNDYYIESADEKAPALAAKYKKIFGLTKENKELAKVFNTKTIGEMYKKAVGLK